MKYHFVYETTNLLTGDKYRGVHSTRNINDGYLGSGKLLILDIKKYGLENFHRQILEFFKTRQEAIRAERKYVNYNWICRPDTYNIVLGGGSGDKCRDRESYNEINFTDDEIREHMKERQKKIDMMAKKQKMTWWIKYGKKRKEEEEKTREWEKNRPNLNKPNLLKKSWRPFF